MQNHMSGTQIANFQSTRANVPERHTDLGEVGIRVNVMLVLLHLQTMASRISSK